MYSKLNQKSLAKLVTLLSEVQEGRSSDQKLVDEMRLLPEFAAFDEKPQTVGLASVIASLPNLANWLLRRASRVGTETALRDVLKYVDSPQLPFRKIMVLSGAKIDAPIELEGDIEVMPFESLPDSTWKEAVLRDFGKSWTNYRPSAALQQRFFLPRQDFEGPLLQAVGEEREFEELNDVRLCMTVLGPYTPLWLGSWIEAEEWVPNLANMAHLPERLNAGNYPRVVGEDWIALSSLYKNWRSLPLKTQRHLRVALSRLNAALRRSEPVDCAIDLGIAVDSVFLSGKAADRGEIGLTLRLRAARFLGVDLKSRLEISDLFSALYSLRSSAVHDGVLKQTIKTRSHAGSQECDVKEVLSDGSVWIARAIRKIVDQGEPDWPRLILE